MKDEKFNFCVGHYWEGNEGEIAVYAYHSEVHYGTMKEAKRFLKYVKKQSDHKYQIFKVEPIKL
jgi:hypothetical protein